EDVAGPFPVYYELGEYNQTLWFEGFTGTKEIVWPWRKPWPKEEFEVKEYIIDPLQRLPELNQKDNRFRTDKVLNKLEKINFSFGTGIEKPERTQIFYSPVIGWNNYNKFLPGILFHNIGVIE